jgi:hypothetical protein
MFASGAPMTPSQARSLRAFGYEADTCGIIRRPGRMQGGTKIRGRDLTRFDLDVGKFITALREGKSEDKAIEIARKTK